jgi:CRISPR/Cas system CMR-associated protein Cmr1 (group 7 of RAMP superfamily)
MAAIPLSVDRNRSYQNVRDLRTKFITIFNNVCSLDFKIFSLTERWLNEAHSKSTFFEVYVVYLT